MKKAVGVIFILIFLIPLFKSQGAVLAGSPPASFAGYASLPTANPQGVLSSQVQTTLAQLQPGEKVTVVVTLKKQADLRGIRGLDRNVRLNAAIQALKATATASQRSLVALLKTRREVGLVQKVETLWIFDGLVVTATREVIAELAAHSDVLRITLDEVNIVPSGPLMTTLETNLSVINASAIWNLGYAGRRVVVANMDTGVDASHPDLAQRWRGGSNSWFDPYGEHPSLPVDLNGHGTATMGIMVGGDTGGTSIGVAPEAQWIAVKIFNDQGNASASAIHLGFQWLLDPDGDPTTADAPQVVNNSWSFGTPGCDLEFQLDLQALRAADILPVFAAGNYGPDPSTSPSPANYPEAFAVGATRANDLLYGFSSRGPSACGEAETVYPEMVAPGVNVRTADLLGQYSTATGTSISAPHVAGALALLLSAFPNLPADEQAAALVNSAVDLGPAGLDNDFGYGRLDVLAAYQWIKTNQFKPTETPLPPTPTVTMEEPTPTPTEPAATPTPTSDSTLTMHVGDLDSISPACRCKRWDASVTVTVHDNNEALVAGATVSGRWSKGASGRSTCVTDSTGSCTVTNSKLGKRQVTFTVIALKHPGFKYIAAANHDPDGDGDGTKIVVVKQ
ncbi:MAG TPA: S8 family serine peptidase [Anaerolineales bacterium]|nr:S8 family serine peptidase [Anaerolineales bacterium]